VAIAGASVANFWLALMTMDLFAVQLRWLPLLGAGSWQHYVLPALALAAAGGADRPDDAVEHARVISRTISAPPRAKGLGAWAIYRKHALRNALIPIVTIVGLNFRRPARRRRRHRIRVQLAGHRPAAGRRGALSRLSDHPGRHLAIGRMVCVVLVNFFADLPDRRHQSPHPLRLGLPA